MLRNDLGMISDCDEEFGNAQNNLIQNFIQKKSEIEAWFTAQWEKITPPFYGSLDLRNAGYKIAPVDMNLFPAGFNNLSSHYKTFYAKQAKEFLNEYYPSYKKLLIIPESHTRNLAYFESLAVLQDILVSAGREVRIGSAEIEVKDKIIIEPIKREANKISVADFNPDLILLNNDLSNGIPAILENLEQPIRPFLEMGWFKRLKSSHFHHYEKVAYEFSQVMNIDPWLISPYFLNCGEVNFKEGKGGSCLLEQARKLFYKIEQKYQEYQIKDKPYIVVKADSGTYGMGIMMVHDPEELLVLNRKQKTKMSKSKGGMEIRKVILQEGVYTRDRIGESKSTAEPVIYLIGNRILGGFYRLHKEKGADANLNAPGMEFISIDCDALQLESDNTCFYPYRVIARLSMLAAAKEREEILHGA